MRERGAAVRRSHAAAVDPGYNRGMKPSLTLAFSISLAFLACGGSSAGPRDSSVDVSADGPGSGWDPSPPATVTVLPSVLDFGTVDVGATSTPQTVTVVVSGNTVALGFAIVGPGFVLTGSTCADAQPAGSVCALSVKFAPTTIGAATGVLTIGTSTVALAGIGNASSGGPVAPDRIELGTLQVNQAAAVTIVPPRSPASTTCTPSTPDITPASQTCPASGTSDTPCVLTFTFKAATVGEEIHTITCSGGGKTWLTTIVANVVTGPPPTVNPASGIFNATIGNTDSVIFTVSNVGRVAIGPLEATISAGASTFRVVSNECSTAVAPLDTCKIQVENSPVSAGASSGVLTVTDSGQSFASIAVPLVTLRGSGGSRPTLGPNPADFGTVFIGASRSLSFTLKNSGASASDTLGIASGSADFVVDPPACPPVAPGATCTFTVTFTPKGPAGMKAGIITVTEPDGSLLATAKVSGEAVASIQGPTLSVTPAVLDFGTFRIGISVPPQVLTVTNTSEGATGPIVVTKKDDTFSVGGAAYFAMTTTCSGPLAAGASCTISVIYKASELGMASATIAVTDGTTSASSRVTGTAVAEVLLAWFCNGSSSSSLLFASTVVGQTSSELVCTTPDIPALDGGALAITAVLAGADSFTVTSQSCTQTRCSVGVTFTPTTKGSHLGAVTVQVSQGAQTVRTALPLEGTGI
jgi:hypothetical protein